MKRGAKTICSLLAGLTAVGCSDANLLRNQLSTDSVAGISFCTTPAASVVNQLKYIFVIDHSGSNANNYYVTETLPAPNQALIPYNAPAALSPYVADPFVGTDPEGLKRFGPLVGIAGQSYPGAPTPVPSTEILPTNGFLVNLQSSVGDSPNTFYAAIDFNTTVNYATTDNGGLSFYYSDNTTKSSLSDAINYFNNDWANRNDSGYTEYLGALKQINTIISNDIANSAALVQAGAPIVASDYVVFWVSDGAPIVAGGSNGQCAAPDQGPYLPPYYCLETTNAVDAEINNIMALKNGPNATYVDDIIINTGFYHNTYQANGSDFAPLVTAAYPNGTGGQTDATIEQGLATDATTSNQQAASIMQSMAQTGSGAFIDFNSSTINYSEFVVPQRTAKYVLRDFWVQDMNTVWNNGKIYPDTGATGMPDTLRTQMGVTNLNNYDSDGNGLGDGVEYYLFGRPCKDANCNPANAVSTLDLCGQMPAGGYPDTDGDGLNDCEEHFLGSNPTDFDSNQDYVPDQFEWVNNVAFLSGVNNLDDDQDNDGITNYFELKFNTPVNFPNNELNGIPQLSYQLSQVSDNNSQTCYSANVQNLVTMSLHDTIRVYVMESRGAVGTQRRMRVATGKFPNGSSITFGDSDFIDYPKNSN